MSAMTRGSCFLARFFSWRQPVRDAVLRETGREPFSPHSDLAGDCRRMTQAVREAGFVPMTRIVDYNWQDRRSPEELADYLLRHYFREEIGRKDLKEALCRAAEKHCGDDGLIEDAVFTEVLWIWWKT